MADELYAVVWHPQTGKRPDGRESTIVGDLAEAIEDAAHYQEQCRRAGRADRYVAYRLVEISHDEARPALRRHAGLGLLCDRCDGPCRIDGPPGSVDAQAEPGGRRG